MHASIRTNDPSIRAREDSSFLRLRGLWSAYFARYVFKNYITEIEGMKRVLFKWYTKYITFCLISVMKIQKYNILYVKFSLAFK
jgi:hypothetical protein